MRFLMFVLAFAGLINTASAQTVIGLATSEDLEAAGLTSMREPIPGGTVIVDNVAGTFGLAYDSEWGTTTIYRNYRNVKVGDSEVITLGSGAVGNANPTFVSYQEGVMSAGAVFEIEAKKDGWMTLFTKMNPNKQYLVFEGETGAVAYTLGVAGADYKINYTLPSYADGDNAGLIDFDSPESSKYFVQATKQAVNIDGTPLWIVDGNCVVSDVKPEGGSAFMEDIPGQYKPQSPWVVAGMESSPGESTGFLTFRVKEGKTYYFGGLGTKAVCGGFVFTEGDAAPIVTFCATGDLPEVVFKSGTQTTVPPYTFPESFEVSLSDRKLGLTQGVDQGVYTISVSGKTVDKEVTLTLDVPGGWDGFISMSDVDFTPDFGGDPLTRAYESELVPLEAMLGAGFKEGNTMTFPVDGESHSGQFYLYKDGMADMANQIEVDFNVEFDNERAYENVLVEINKAQADYEEALAFVEQYNPLADVTEMKEIIENAISEARTGAEQALESAIEDGGIFSFPFSTEEIEGMINEMKRMVVENTETPKLVVGLATPEDLENAGLTSTKQEIPGGTVIVDNVAGTFGLAYDDNWGVTSIYKNYREVKIGDSEVIILGHGAIGNSNPTFVSYQEGVMSAGAVFEIEAKKDGWMTLFTKMNPNKQYLVFEGETGAVAYTLGVAGDNYKINYTLPSYEEGDKAGLIDFDSPEASKYFINATKQAVNEEGVKLWMLENGEVIASDFKPDGGAAVMEEIPGATKPQLPWRIAGMESAPSESTGFLTFRVKEGKTYYFGGLGTKAACGGFVFTAGETAPSVTFCATDDLPEVVFKSGTQTTVPPYTFPESFEVSLSDRKLELTQGVDQGVYTISVSGKTIDNEVTLTLDVPGGWDGFISMSDADFTPDFGGGPVTRTNELELVPVEAMLEAGFKEGNSMTFPVDGESHSGQFYLYKDGMADMANQIEVNFNVEFDNERAYEKVLDEINMAQAEYEEALSFISQYNPLADVAEMKEIIENALSEARSGAEQALKSAIEDGGIFNFPFSAEEIEGMINEMKQMVIDSTSIPQTVVGLATPEDFEEAGLTSTKQEMPGGTVIVDNVAGTFGLAYDDSWGTTITYRNYREVKVGDSEVITLGSGAVGNSNPTFVSYQEGVMSAGAVFEIAAKKDGWMTLFTKINPNKQYVVFEGETGAVAYTLGVAGADYKISYTLPSYAEGENAGLIDFDSPEASKYFVQATKQAVNEEGVKLWILENEEIVASDVKPEGGKAIYEDVPGQTKPQYPWVIAGMESAPGESTGFLTFRVKEGKTYYFGGLGTKAACGGFVFTAGETAPSVTFCATDDLPKVIFNVEALISENQAAYEEVIAKIEALQKKFEVALEESQEETPDYDFSEWTEIIEGALDQAKEGAQQALVVANEEEEEFQYAFDGEEIEAMIAEMKIAPLMDKNYAAYDLVMAEINEVQAYYEEALAFIAEYNPGAEITEMKGIIDNAISEAKAGAEQALNAAHDDGSEFFYPFSSEEIYAMVAEMKTMAVEGPNQIAYAEVVAKIDAVEKEYIVALNELKAEYPDYDFSEWESIIGGMLDETKAGAEMALKSANEDGDAFQFAFDGGDIENMIEEMRNDVITSGIGRVNATDNATYYDLNGNKINNPDSGTYIKIVEGKASKVIIK